MKSNALTPFRRLKDTLLIPKREANVVVAAFFTSPRCPWCVAVLKEQLEPRVRATQPPRLLLVEFDVDEAEESEFPDGKRRSARQWGQIYSLKLTPTLIMLDQMARPILAPLQGYASRDFYGAYLEEQINAANNYWQNRRST